MHNDASQALLMKAGFLAKMERREEAIEAYKAFLAGDPIMPIGDEYEKEIFASSNALYREVAEGMLKELLTSP